VRALFPRQIDFVSALADVGAGPRPCPASIGHVLVLSDAVLGGLRGGRIVVDEDAAAGVVDKLVTFVDLFLVPLVDRANEIGLFVGLPA
jgi:hypothetical protein